MTLLLIPLLPLLAAVAAPLLARRGAAGPSVVLAAAASFAILSVGGAFAPDGLALAPVATTWATTGPLTLTVGLEPTPLGGLLALLVSGVGTLIALYASGYVEPGAPQGRFFAWYGGFLAAMLALVLAGSTLLLFAAWEAVGLASWGLIGFWYERSDARAAARKAFLVTRVGDAGLLLGWLALALAIGTTDIAATLDAVRGGELAPGLLVFAAAGLLLGAFGKSAQLPFTAWLPDAMAGPAPVSALIHSATMVAAGVFLLLRFFPLLEAAPGVLAVVFWVGAATALVAALAATAATDLKRVLAWSTVSQLGEMMLALGLGSAFAAGFHLTTHALFKSALFLAAGSVGHVLGHHDLRRMGGLARTMPFTTLAFAAAGLTLAGVPPLSAFWSEEAILGAALGASPWAASLLVLLVFLAGVYIARAGVAAFAPRAGSEPAIADERAGWRLAIPALALALAALVFGGLAEGRMHDLLPSGGSGEVPRAWTVALVVAGGIGLAFGALRAWNRGAAPAFGSFPRALVGPVEALPSGVADAVLRVGALLRPLETGLDRGAAGIATGARSMAAELDRAETALDAAARESARATRSAARGAERLEQRGFAAGGDEAARALGGLGNLLRRLQTGKLYLYTLTLFVWTLAAVVAGAVFWW